MDVAALLASLDPVGAESDLRPAIALLATRELELEEEALNPPVRRAMLVLAAGGDPHRELQIDAPAVSTLARDVDSAPLRHALTQGLDELEPPASPFPHVAAAVAELRADADLAVRAWACALLADEL